MQMQMERRRAVWSGQEYRPIQVLLCMRDLPISCRAAGRAVCIHIGDLRATAARDIRVTANSLCSEPNKIDAINAVRVTVSSTMYM